VPGTPDADAAVLIASVPVKATVTVEDAKVTVVYEGSPKFVKIEGTKVYYAVNSPYAVLRADGKYYCCHEGVWFVSPAPDGPWLVATSVPQVVYTIPSTSPLYNVTYVHVYEATPTEVTVGYTGGYTGQYVVGGLLMFGLGYAIGHSDDWDDHWHYASFHYHSSYFSYGCGARFDYYAGRYVRGGAARVYGPYGGAGRWAAYNPATGRYARGAYRYGPRGSAYARSTYNPRTGRYAGRASVSNVYSSWGRSVVSGSEGWAKFGHRSGPRGAVGGFRTSEGGGAIAGKGRFGHTGGVAKNRHGDVYVGRDGNIYKRSESGQWQKRTRDAWSDTSRVRPSGAAATPRSGAPRAARRPMAAPREAVRPTSPQAMSRRPDVSRSNIEQLRRDHNSRRIGNQRASGSQRYRSSASRSRRVGRSGGRRR
jgi:hypothetical protein